MGYKRYKMLQKYINGEPQDEYRQGELIDDTVYSTLEDCNEGNDNPDEPIADTIYQWVEISDDFVCANFNKYTKEKEQISYDRGVTWEDTGQTRRGNLIEVQSEDCGYNHILFRYEDEEVLFEMYEPCWLIDGDTRRPRLNLRVWNKTENDVMRLILYEQGAYNRGWGDTQPQIDDRFTMGFSLSGFYRAYNYYIAIAKMDNEGWLHRKYQTTYFNFTSSEIRNECE